MSRVAEWGQVTHMRHVTGQRCSTEGGGLVMHALRELFIALCTLLTLLGLVGHLAVTCLNALFLHGERPIYVMQLVVKPTGVAHRVAIRIAPPESCRSCLAVCAAGARSSRGGQPAFRLNERSVLAVHLVVQAASVAEVMPGTISPPQRGGGGTTVDTFSSL